MERLNKFILKIFPDLELKLIIGKMNETAESFIKKMVMISTFFSFTITIVGLFILLKEEITLLLLIPLFGIIFFFILFVAMQLPSMAVKSIAGKIEADLIYTIRHFLLMMESGNSMVKSFDETAKLDTFSAKYFKEIVLEIDMGASMKEAVEFAMLYTPSDHFKQVMAIIKNSLETGADIKKSLKSNVNAMVEDKIIEIKDYGAKLGPISMFYMIIGTIVPSLGVSIFVIGSTFLPSVISEGGIVFILYGFLVLLVIIQVFFYLVFKSMRPQVSV